MLTQMVFPRVCDHCRLPFEDHDVAHAIVSGTLRFEPASQRPDLGGDPVDGFMLDYATTVTKHLHGPCLWEYTHDRGADAD